MAKEPSPEKKTKRVRRQPASDAIEALGVPLNRIDPDEDFSDVEGDPTNEFGLLNEESDRHYHWARNTPDDLGYYKGGIIPYRVEHASADGVSPRMSSEFTEGEAIQKRDLVLMSCDKAKWQKRNRYERVQTLATNEGMIKKLQRDRDLRKERGDEDLEMRA